MKLATISALGMLMIAAVAAFGADNPPATTQAAKVDGAPLGKKGEWVQIAINCRGPLETIDAVRIAKFQGVNGDGISGVVADRISGDVYIILNYSGNLPKAGAAKGGIWKSADKGVSFVRVDLPGGAVAGTGLSPFCMDMDPNGKRLAFYTMAAGKSGITLDGGATWRLFKLKTAQGFSHGCVDWSDPEAKAIVALSYEGPVFSKDSGETWARFDMKANDRPSRAPVLGLADAKTFWFASGRNSKLQITEDGKTWKTVYENTGSPVGTVSRVFKGVAYLASPKGLLVSKDKGQTWEVQGAPLPDKDAWIGPVFGKDENHMLVMGVKGVFETTDGGKTWKIAMELPEAYKTPVPGDWGGVLAHANLAYDSKADIFYLASAGLPMYRFQR